MKQPVKRIIESAFRRLSLAIAVFVIAASIPATVAASSLQSKIDNLQKEIQAGQAEADRLGDRADTLQGRVNALQTQVNIIQKKIDLNQVKYTKLKNDIKKTQKQIDERSEFLGKNLAALYADANISTLEMVAASGSIGDYIDKQEYRTAIRDKVATSVVEVKELEEKLTRQQKQVKKVLAEQKAQRSALATKKSEQSSLLAQTRGQESRYRGLVKDLRAEKAKMEAALYAAMRSGSYRTAPVGPVSAGEVVGPVGNTGLSTGPHLHLETRRNGSVVHPGSYIQVQPLACAPGCMTQGFGDNPHFYGPGGHPGLDYGAPVGTPIRAISGGYMYRGCSANLLGTTGYGYVAIVEHGNGVVSIYGHMSGAPAACNYTIPAYF